MNEITESDWMAFREIHAVARDRFCERTLTEVVRRATDVSATVSDRYGTVSELIKQRDCDFANTFNVMRRSTAIPQLAMMHRLELLTAEDLDRFSPDVRARVNSIIEIHRPR